MGTKAVLVIDGYKENIIGMTMDGFHKNLISFSQECFRIAKRLRILGKFKSNKTDAIAKVLEILVENHKDWLFLDDPRNPEWVSYSAKLVLTKQFQNLYLYNGYLEDRVGVFQLNKS